MIHSYLLKPISESINFEHGLRLLFKFQRMNSGGSLGGAEECLDYQDCLSLMSGEKPEIIVLKLRDLANRIEDNLVRVNTGKLV